MTDFIQQFCELGHTPKKDETGCIDIFGYDFEMHNGPACATCGEGFCIHCARNRGTIPVGKCERGEIGKRKGLKILPSAGSSPAARTIGYTKWSDEEIASLRKWHKEGVLEKVIAARLGRTPPAVNQKRKQLGLPSNVKYDFATVKVTFMANPELATKVQQAAIKDGITVSEFLRRFLNERM